MTQPRRTISILMADDDPDDRLLAKDALEESRLANDLQFVVDGEDLMNYLHRRGDYCHLAMTPLPGLILLDLNMPKKDGREALAEIKADPDLRRIPVVVMTSSRAETDIVETYNLHASSYLVKPIDLEKFAEVVKAIENFWFNVVVLPD